MATLNILCRHQATLSLLVLLAATSRAAEPASAEPADPLVTMVFVGDVMLDWGPAKYVAAGHDPFENFASIFQDADVVVGNLECVIATSGTPEDKPYIFRASPAVLPFLGRHLSAVSVANNHTGDFGKQAFVEELDRLQEAQVPYFGGGRTLADARRPLILMRHGLRIALLGYNEFKPRSFAANETTPGVAWSIDDQVLSDIRNARSKWQADVVIPFMHWGEEYTPQPNERQTKFARQMIDAGAALVIGAHPHVTQGVDAYHGGLIFYSLGNFVFNDDETDPNAYQGWCVRVKVDRKGTRSWDIILARIDDQGIPSPDMSAKTPSGGRVTK